jgi:hypothetical protein
MNIYDRIINILLEARINSIVESLLEEVDVKGERGEFLRVSRQNLPSDAPISQIKNKTRGEMAAASKGKQVNLSPKTFANKVSNTDSGEVQGGSKFSNLKNWARTMQSNNRDGERRRRVFNQVKSNTDDPAIVRSSGSGQRELVAGNTRASLRSAMGMPVKAHVYRSR